MNNTSRSVDAPSSIAAALVLAAIGAIFYNILPMFIGTAQDHRGWGLSEAGLMGTFFFVGYTAVTISAFFWARKLNWKVACLVAVPIAVIPMLAVGYVDSYFLNAVFVIVSGGASSAIYVIGTIAIGDTSNPPRWMGAKIGAETALGGVFLLFAPALLIGPFGFKGVVFGVAGITLLCLPFLLFMPKHGSKGVSHSSGLSETTSTGSIDISDNEKKTLWFMLIAIVIFFTGETAIWSFLERMGNSSGFDPNVVGVVLAASLGAAMSGAFSEAAIGDRFGYSPMILFSVALFIIGTTILYLAKNIPLYATGTMIVTYSVGFGVSAFMALVAYLDRGGRYIILAVPALGFGAIFGPGLAGVILDNVGAIGLLGLSIVSGIISYVLVSRGMSIAYTEVSHAKLKDANAQNS